MRCTTRSLSFSASLLIALAAAIYAPRSLDAQGMIMPRPCFVPPCPPDRPCPMVRTMCPPIAASQIARVGSEVHARLADRVIRYDVVETFVNRGGGLGEADYIFPLPTGAAFEDLRLSINGEMVSGEIMNADEARQIYQQIVSRRRDPALVEWMGHGLLRAHIFPLNPGEKKKVEVRFQTVAPREGDAVRIDYATTRATPQDGAGVNDDGRTSFTLEYPDGDAYGRPYSPTHELDVHDDGGSYHVQARGSSKDFTILLPVRRSTEPAISMLATAPSGETGYALITLTPPAMHSAPTPRDVQLVIDVSGSMDGAKLAQAKSAARTVLGTLTSIDRFRLIAFSTDVEPFDDHFRDATPANLAAARRWVDGLDAEGSTNISGAIDEALGVPETPGRLGVVLFMTDGAPTVGVRDPDAIARAADEARGNRRIFTFGVGRDVNATLIEQLALEGHGTASFVRPDESVDRAVGIVASRLRAPLVTNLRITADGAHLQKTMPNGSVDLFAGQDLVVLTRFEGDGAGHLQFTGDTPNGPVTWTQSVIFPSRTRSNPFVARLWAVQRIGWLDAQRRHEGDNEELDNEIKDLGERFGIPTAFTSYLVQEPGMVAGAPPPMRLEDRMAAGAGTAGAPSSANGSFDAAKAASGQRAAQSMAAADEATGVGASSSAVHRAGDHLFVQRDGVWTDVRYHDGMKVIRVKPYSDAYFAVIDLVPEIGAALGVGERVIVAGRDVAVEVTPDGTDRLSDADKGSLRTAW